MAEIDQTDEGIEALNVGDVEKASAPFPIVFQIRLKRELTTKQLEKVDSLVDKLLIDHGDIVFIRDYSDEAIEFHKENTPDGQSTIKLFFTNTTITEALVVGSNERLKIMTEFLWKLQKQTNSAYIIWIQDDRYPDNTGFGLDKKGIYPTVSMNNCPSDKRKKHVSLPDYLDGNAAAINKAVKGAADDLEPDAHPWIFEPFDHPKYPELVRKHKEKMAEKEKEAEEAAAK